MNSTSTSSPYVTAAFSGFFFLAALTSNAQTALRTKYYLPDTTGKKATLSFYTKKDSLVFSKPDTTHIVTFQGGTIKEDITRITTINPTKRNKVKVKVQGATLFDPDLTAFSVEQKKDTLLLKPIPYTDPKLDKVKQAWNSSRLTHTYYIPIPKSTGYTHLYSRAYEFGVIAIPARIYLGLKSGIKAKAVIGGGAAAYFGLVKGTEYFYDNGTSTKVTRTSALYIGVSQLSVNSDNTDGQVTKDSDEPAITLGFTHLWGRQDFKIGYILGTDLPLTKAGWKWDFAPAPYIGVTVSLALSPFAAK